MRRPILGKLLWSLVAVVVIGVALALLAWRVTAGPVALDWLTPYIAQALSPEDGRFRVEIGGTELRVSDDVELVELVVVDLRAVGDDGAQLAEMPEVDVGLSLAALARGQIAVTYLQAAAPELVLLRREDGSIGLSAERGGGGGQIDVRGLVGALLDPSEPGSRTSYFEHLEIVGGTLILIDQASGEEFQARDAELILRRHLDGLGGDLRFSLLQDAEPAAVHLTGRYLAPSGWTRFGLNVDRLKPSALANLAPDVPLGGIELPLRASLEGGFHLDGEQTPIRFELAAGPGTVTLTDILAAPLPIEALQASGEVSSDLQALGLTRFRMTSMAASLSASADVAWRQGQIAATAELEAANVSAGDLELFWPPEAADAARAWVVEHITDGVVPKAQATVNIEAGDLDQEPVPPGIIEGGFDLEGLTVRYYEDLPPLTDVDGSARFNALDMEFEVTAARVGEITVDEGSIVITGMGIPGREATQLETVTKAQGSVRDILSLIDHPPLGLAAKADLSPADTAGTASVDLRIGLPLHREVTDEEVRVAASATLSNAAIPAPDFDLTEGDLRLEVDNTGLDLAGDARIDGIP